MAAYVIHGNKKAKKPKTAAAQPCNASFPPPQINLKPSIRIYLHFKWRHTYRNNLQMIRDNHGCWVNMRSSQPTSSCVNKPENQVQIDSWADSKK